jgi:hypothetical protein
MALMSPYADSSYRHDFYEFGYTGEASPVDFFMLTDKLATAVFTEILLMAVVYFPVSDYGTSPALGAFEFYGDLHSSIALLLFPVSYLFHHTLWITSLIFIKRGQMSCLFVLR